MKGEKMLQLLSPHKFLSLLFVQLSDFLRIYIVTETLNKQKGDLKIQESVQVQVTVMGRHHLRPGRRTLPPAKGLHDLDKRVLPSVFKTVSTAYKSPERLKSPSPANSKKNPGNK